MNFIIFCCLFVVVLIRVFIVFPLIAFEHGKFSVLEISKMKINVSIRKIIKKWRCRRVDDSI